MSHFASFKTEFSRKLYLQILLRSFKMKFWKTTNSLLAYPTKSLIALEAKLFLYQNTNTYEFIGETISDCEVVEVKDELDSITEKYLKGLVLRKNRLGGFNNRQLKINLMNSLFIERSIGGRNNGFR
uniref:Uncharacterized protein n=1 Tax=Climaconeis sp. TaxID=2846830 RepID=A0A8F8X830_9STRA|nr:hypothetical protein [Climaconeis sp.]